MKNQILFILFFILGTFSLYAQNITVTGTVTDDSNDPLTGVSVVQKGTTNGVFTDIDGKYSIQVTGSGQTLVFSFLGMQAREIAAPNTSGTLNVIMSMDAAQLEEVIVTGYGTYKKSAYAGSASTVRVSDMEDIPAIDFSTMLQGNAPGVQINSTSGQPGGSTNITIRGMGSFSSGSNTPLYVIDGIPVMSGNIASSTSNDAGLDIMSTINNSDIENITIIKDAAAASLYGSRANNGVVLITTKSGRQGKPVFNLKMDYGLSSQATDYRETMSGAERREMFIEGLRNQAIYYNKVTDEAEIQKHVDKYIDQYAPEPWSGYTDWKKVLFRKNSPFRNVDFSASGGDSKFSYFTSLAYTNQTGLSYQSDFERISGRLNVKYQMNNQIQLGANILYSTIQQDVNSEGGTYTSPIYSSRHKVSGSDPVYNEDGTFNTKLLSNGKRNPKATSLYNYKREKVDRAFNTVFLNYSPIKELLFNSTFSLDHTNTRYNSWTDPRTSDGESKNGVLNSRATQYDQLVWKNNLTYMKTFNKRHNLDVLVGYEINDYKRDLIEGNIEDFPATDEDKHILDNGAANQQVSGKIDQWRMVSYLGRANYNMDNKYFIGGSVRMDGSSRFHKDSRWGTFWSVSGAWRIGDETFMEPLQPVLSETRLRASYGTNGALPSYGSNYGYFPYMDLVGYGYKYDGKPGFREMQIGDKNLKWEKNYNFNVGLDFRLIDRINFSVEYYNRKTKDLLMDLPISLTTGFGSYMTNIGEMENNGIDIDISAEIIRNKDFMWNSSLNFGHNKNKITKFDGEQTILKESIFIREIGHPFNMYYVKEFAGINPETGIPEFYINGDGENAREKTTDSSKAEYIMYKGPDPTLSGGWSNTFRYKIIDLSFTWTFTLGGYSYDAGASKLATGGKNTKDNIQKYYKDRWQKPGDHTRYEMFVVGNKYDMSSVRNSRNVHSTDHMRLKNLTVGISIPKNISRQVKLENVRAYFSAVNLLTFAAYDDYDPEIPRNGYVYFDSPKLKTLTFGLDIKF